MEVITHYMLKPDGCFKMMFGKIMKPRSLCKNKNTWSVMMINGNTGYLNISYKG
jgi:hypothetical protein